MHGMRTLLLSTSSLAGTLLSVSLFIFYWWVFSFFISELLQNYFFFFLSASYLDKIISRQSWREASEWDPSTSLPPSEASLDSVSDSASSHSLKSFTGLLLEFLEML